MPTQVQFRRGTSAQNDTFTGAAGELSVDTDNYVVRVHDGSTAGGYTLAKNDLSNITTVGVITATTIYGTNGTFSGNLNVAGTLTYEDVTNVDSVGIVTAGGGIVVTTGGITASGQTITAGSFVGDGSSLTGIDASSISNSTSNVSVASASDVTVTTSGSLAATFDTSQNLTIVGDCVATDFNSTSDINLKKNIEKIESPLDKLAELSGVTFQWIENNKQSGGVIAQDVEKVLPELVGQTEDHKTVNYNGLIGLLVECVKEQQKQIDELKNRA